MGKKKVDKPKTWLLIENPQLLSNLHETRWKYSSHEYFMLLEFQLDWIKIVDFLLVAKFKACLLFFTRTLLSRHLNWVLKKLFDVVH